MYMKFGSEPPISRSLLDDQLVHLGERQKLVSLFYIFLFWLIQQIVMFCGINETIMFEFSISSRSRFKFNQRLGRERFGWMASSSYGYLKNIKKKKKFMWLHLKFTCYNKWILDWLVYHSYATFKRWVYNSLVSCALPVSNCLLPCDDAHTLHAIKFNLRP